LPEVYNRRMRFTRVLGVAVLAAALSTSAVPRAQQVDTWPRFRGPQARGIAEKQGLPEAWDGVAGKNVRWKVEVPGLAHSSPIVWGDRLFLTSAVSSDAKATFKPGLYGEGTASEDKSEQRWIVLAIDRRTGKTIWERTAYQGTPNVYVSSRPGRAPELVTNASNFIRGYDPDTGKELWRLGGSSKITAPTPVFTDDFILVASGRRDEKPIFVLTPGSRGDLTLPAGKTSSDRVVWSKRGRGPYMPTPLIYDDIAYVLGNDGIFDAYDLATGREIYRERIPHSGSGFSASPVAADGHIILSSEDGDMFVVAAGDAFSIVGKNPMGEPLMATPAIAGGTLYVRGEKHLFAIGAAR